MINISRKQARIFLLKYQELYPPRKISSLNGLVKFIEKVGCIQYDPLNKSGRNADLVLQSRCNNYTEDILSGLLYDKRKLIDGWDKNMSIWSAKDWPYFRRNRNEYKKRFQKRLKELNPARLKIRKLIKNRGAINSHEVDLNQKVNWSWAPTKIGRAVLESMYHYGELIIHRKEGTRKYYDFTQKHLPESLLKSSEPNRSKNNYDDWYVKRRIGSIGMIWNRSGDAWLGIRDLNKEGRTKAIQRLLKEESILEITIQGFNDIFYMDSKLQSMLKNGLNEGKRLEASIIAPLDNLIWDRNLVSQLFGFDYRWEVYTPVSKRKYGYYVLPILYGDKFIARFEPIVDREKKTLLINNWWWEEHVKMTSDTARALTRCLSSFMKFTQSSKIHLLNKKAKSMNWLHECSSK